MEPKRIKHSGARNARLDATGTVNCGKSTNTMHNTDLLEDLVGMVGLGGDNDEDMDLDSNYQYGEDLRSPKYNTAAGDQQNRYGVKLNGRGRKQAQKESMYSNGVVRPGSSTNATLRDFRSRTDARAKRRSLRSDMHDELELNSLDRDSNEEDVLHLDLDGRRDGARDALDEQDQSRLQIGTEEDNSQIKLIPKEMGADSHLRASDIRSRDSADIEMENFDERASLCRPAAITQTELIQILEQTLYQYYLVDAKKFNVRRLLKKVDPDLVKRLEARIKFKVNKENRSLNKIFIDFGPYPLLKAWQIRKAEKEQIENRILGANENNEEAEQQNYIQRNLKKALIENQNKQALFIAPDEDNYSQHGIRNLVIKYQEFATTLELDSAIHKESPFYRVNMLEGVLEEFVGKLNQHLEPLKDRAQSIDRFSFMFLMIGFFATLLIDLITAYMFPMWICIAVSIFYVVILAIVFYRNNL